MTYLQNDSVHRPDCERLDDRLPGGDGRHRAAPPRHPEPSHEPPAVRHRPQRAPQPRVGSERAGGRAGEEGRRQGRHHAQPPHDPPRLPG